MEVKQAIYIISSPRVELCPAPELCEVAFIGRSNVGKSSLINMLSNKQELAKVSSSPGKTQMINHFLINNNMYWVDLPGYGFAKVSQAQRASWKKMIWNYLEQRSNLSTLFVLIDARHGPQEIDIQFINQLGEKQIPFTIIFTKTDKITQREVAQNIKAFNTELLQTWHELPVQFNTSAVKRTGRTQVLQYVETLHGLFGQHKASSPMP
jgi:GTP-binding protein